METSKVKLVDPSYLIGAENPELVNKAFSALVDRAQDLAWVAGLVEGEGCFSVGKNRVKKKEGGAYKYVRCVFVMHMTDYDVMQKASEILGLKLKGPYKRYEKRKDGNERKPYWAVETNSQSKVREICDLLYSYMGERRRSKIREVLAVLDDKDEQRRNRKLAKDKGSLRDAE